MKELQHHLRDKVEIGIQQDQKKQHKYLGSQRQRKGLTCWELDIETDNIIPAQFESVSLELKNGIHKKLVAKPFHLYAIALNKENAKRKFMKIMKERQ